MSNDLEAYKFCYCFHLYEVNSASSLKVAKGNCSDASENRIFPAYAEIYYYLVHNFSNISYTA